MGVIRLSHIFRYPVKGLSPEPMDAVSLTEGAALPRDRMYALARPGGAVDPENPKWARKPNFLCLMLDEQLAEVRTELDGTGRRLVAWRDDVPVLDAEVRSVEGQAAIEQFFHGLVGDSIPSRPRWVAANDGEFMDSQDKTVSLINLATVREMEGKWGQGLDLRRFRSNLYIEGAAPWQEHEWIGATLKVGETLFSVHRRNPRCAATNVDPATGARDRDIPRAMMDTYGHRDLGLNLHVRKGGRIAVGDVVTVEN